MDNFELEDAHFTLFLISEVVKDFQAGDSAEKSMNKIAYKIKKHDERVNLIANMQ